MTSYKKILKSAVPLSFASISLAVISITDTAMIGHLGSQQLASGILAMTLYFFLLVYGEGLLMSFGPKFASAYSAGDYQLSTNNFISALVIIVCYSVIVIVFLFFGSDFLILIGQEQALSKLAQNYLTTISFVIIPSLIFALYWELFIVLERTKIILLVSILAIVSNFFLNYLLIYGKFGLPKLGLQGAALSSMLSVTISITILTIYAIRKKILTFLFRQTINHSALKKALGKMVKFAIPIAFTQVSAVAFITVSTFIMGLYGKVVLSAHAIVLQITELAIMFIYGFSDTAAIFCAQTNACHHKLKQIIKKHLILTLAVTITLAITLMLTKTYLPYIFLSSSDPNFNAIYNWHQQFSNIVYPSLVMFTSTLVLLGVLRGIGDAVIPLQLTTFSYWIIGVIIHYLFFNLSNLGAISVWYCLILTTLIIMLLLAYRTRQLLKQQTI